MDVVARVIAFALGAALVLTTINSAVRTFVLPRSAPTRISRTVFVTIRAAFDLRLRRAITYDERDRVMAPYAPAALLMLPFTWLVLVYAGYVAMFWAVGTAFPRDAAMASGSALLTLGFFSVRDGPPVALSFTEAALGLGLVALLIAYLPTIYGAFSRRETAVSQLAVRAGEPPSAVEMLLRFHRIDWNDRLEPLWITWEAWFAEVEETHTSLGSLVFFRSPRPGRSWVTAAGAVLDAASLSLAALDTRRDPQAALCIRSGFLCLRHIGDFFGLPYDPDPAPTDPISVTRDEFEEALDQLAAEGVALKPDRDQAWRDFNGWRVNYDEVLLGLATLTMAPWAPWSSDRGPAYRRPPVRRGRPQ